MTLDWERISWIFRGDGGFRDLYVQDVSISDWEILIDLLNSKYTLKYGLSGGSNTSTQIDKSYIIQYLIKGGGQSENQTLTIILNDININCHFFFPDEIEFDIDPSEINSVEDYCKIEEFMISVSETLKNQVTLTFENDPTIPLIKIDVTRGINRLLSFEEFDTIIKSEMSRYRIKKKYSQFLMFIFPRKYVERFLKSALKQAKPTPKKCNQW